MAFSEVFQGFLHVNNELLREYATSGNVEGVKQLLDKKVNVDGQNQINGMTALHWACLRGHVEVVRLLLIAGAATTIPMCNQLLPMQMTENPDIQCLLEKAPALREQGAQRNQEAGSSSSHPQSSNTVTSARPNESARRNAPVSRVRIEREAPDPEEAAGASGITPAAESALADENEHLINVFVRKVGTENFSKVEMPKQQLLYQTLISSVSFIFDIDAEKIVRVKKLPNTSVRGNDDVKKLKNGDKLEISLTST